MTGQADNSARPTTGVSATRLSIHAERAADILAAIKRFGAATIYDLSVELNLHQETIRKSLANLVETGEVSIIETATTHSRALYGMPDLDDQAEFDLYRTRSSNWPRGQHGRDYLVAAMFGAPPAEVRP